MRTRTKYDGPEYGDTLHQVRATSRGAETDPWGPWGGWANVGSSALSVIESSGNYVIEDDNTPSKAPKTVTHTKHVFKRSPITHYDEYTALNRYEAQGNNVHWYSWGNYGVVGLTGLSTSYPKTINQLKVEAMHKFHKANEVDTLLNLVESPQLVSSGYRLLDLLKRRKFALAGSSSFLAWSFGLAPLIADIQKVNAAVANIKRDMDNYIRTSKSHYRISQVCIGSLSPNITATGYGINSSVGGSWWHVGVFPMTQPTLRVGVAGRRNVEYNSDDFKRLDYVIKRFIATGPASLAWEKIPFSFVVDWFINLSGLIDALDNSLTGFSRHIEAIWMSEKYVVLVPVYKHKYGGWTSDSDGKQTALNELSYYHREALSPDPSIAMSGRFGKKQASITAALLHQIVAGLRTWR